MESTSSGLGPSMTSDRKFLLAFLGNVLSTHKQLESCPVSEAWKQSGEMNGNREREGAGCPAGKAWRLKDQERNHRK